MLFLIDQEEPPSLHLRNKPESFPLESHLAALPQKTTYTGFLFNLGMT